MLCNLIVGIAFCYEMSWRGRGLKWANLCYVINEWPLICWMVALL